MANRPKVVLFDILETLIDRDSLAARLEEAGQPANLLEPWFLRADITGNSLVEVAEKLMSLNWNEVFARSIFRR